MAEEDTKAEPGMAFVGQQQLQRDLGAGDGAELSQHSQVFFLGAGIVHRLHQPPARHFDRHTEAAAVQGFVVRVALHPQDRSHYAHENGARREPVSK